MAAEKPKIQRTPLGIAGSFGILAKVRDLHLASGSLFANRFEIDRLGGSGGMGTIYRALDRHSGDFVALKLIHGDALGPDEAERFTREAQLLAELRHPGIVAHVAHGQTADNRRYLAMEWLDGEDLGRRLSCGPLPLRQCVTLLQRVADALAVAHARGIVHRDLKPQNLFLPAGEIGGVKILDFGIARRLARSQALTRTGMVIGTPEYMAPEQARGARELLPAADLFSLGCVFYECLTGQPPFVADHIAAVLVRILFEEPAPIEEQRPGVPTPLVALLRRMLAKDPAQRPKDAAALRAELALLPEVAEPMLALTLPGPQPRQPSFAESEQNLVSIVLASPQEEQASDKEVGLEATLSGSTPRLDSAAREALLQALAALGTPPDFLASGAVVVTVSQMASAQDQATLAARAALLIKARWPEAVVSLATGRGAIRGYTAVGEVVEQAARVLRNGTEQGGERGSTGIYLDALSSRLLTGRFAQTLQSDGARLLFEEKEADASRPLLGKPTPCVGREEELSTLEAQLAGCIEESEARAVLITAPPGGGKSRLRHEFLRRVAQRSEAVTVVLGRGDLMTLGAPYGIISQAIQKLCGLSGSEPPSVQRAHLTRRIGQSVPAAEQKRVTEFLGELCCIPFPDEGNDLLLAARRDPRGMHEQVRRAFLDWLGAECQRAGVLLVLDDLHWGDMLSVGLIDSALRELRSAPLYVLSLARPEVHEVFPKLWPGHRLQEIPLKPLGRKACERLVQQVLGKKLPSGVLLRIVEHSAGNALFLEETVRLARRAAVHDDLS